MTATDFNNKRINLYSSLRYYQNEGMQDMADKVSKTIDKLEETYFKQEIKEHS